MFKNTCLIFLLAMWMGSIFAPSISSMLQDNEKSIIVLSASEEEQQSQSKDLADDKKFSEGRETYALLSRMFGDTENYFYFQPLSSKSSSEIILPPPESTFSTSI